MKLIQIQFTAWRDDAAAVPPELQAANEKLAGLSDRKREIHADVAQAKALQEVQKTEEVTARLVASVEELDNVETARKAVIAAQEAAAAQAVLEMRSHARVKTTGYQVLNDDGTEVTSIVDDNGEPLPDGAVYEYVVINAAPKLPDWANVKIEQIKGAA